MSVKKIDREYINAKGDRIKEFADGRSEYYHKGKVELPHPADQQYMEITDDADKAVNRRRFIPWTKQSVEDGLQVRDHPGGIVVPEPEASELRKLAETNDDAVPGIDFDDADAAND
jgi:hypothetical protein